MHYTVRLSQESIISAGGAAPDLSELNYYLKNMHESWFLLE